MFWLFVIALWAAMLLSPLLLLFIFLPSGRDCPRCGTETLPIRSRMLRPLRRVAGLRWCMSCGWEGVTRRTPLTRPLPKLEVVPDDADEREDDAPWKGSGH
jgi:hypothetical protein